MDERLEAVVRGALGRLSGPAQGSPGERPCGSELRIASLTMAQFSRLAHLQGGDPLVDEVLEGLRADRRVLLDRPAVEESLGLSGYPQRLREEFARWFERISGYGVTLASSVVDPSGTVARPAADLPPAKPPAVGPVRGDSIIPPERQILSEILGENFPEPHPCYVEPGKSCAGCSRCRTLGF